MKIRNTFGDVKTANYHQIHLRPTAINNMKYTFHTSNFGSALENTGAIGRFLPIGKNTSQLLIHKLGIAVLK
ncbi:hypothetical protein [Methylotuvimicrobium buryatense]|uniref:Uncharacterized protein n=1 Tax=Methylotuvimicrobium buryatense TaxID=95641 RepID=A0A4P9UQK3_METBY|nr:hypothetical protein [Methylotuvimicrobium buryatense]QCW83617.1 hypothetical protein EQU24_16250 [Methylotuvimicrobium buryatense]